VIPLERKTAIPAFRSMTVFVKGFGKSVEVGYIPDFSR
jgi:hypothetical protein